VLTVAVMVLMTVIGLLAAGGGTDEADELPPVLLATQRMQAVGVVVVGCAIASVSSLVELVMLMRWNRSCSRQPISLSGVT